MNKQLLKTVAVILLVIAADKKLKITDKVMGSAA